MKKLLAVALGILFLGSTQLALAGDPAPGTRSPGVKARKHKQNKRVKQGVRSGELTKDETKDLRENRKETNKMIRDAKSDGSLTKEERKDIHKKMNEDSKDIYDAKHDADKRPRAERRDAVTEASKDAPAAAPTPVNP